MSITSFSLWVNMNMPPKLEPNKTDDDETKNEKDKERYERNKKEECVRRMENEQKTGREG